MFGASALLTFVVLARVWTGPFGWHIGPLPLPPFSPYRLFTLAALMLIVGTLMTDSFRRAWSRRDVVVFYAVAVVVLWLMALGPEPEWSTPWRALMYGPVLRVSRPAGDAEHPCPRPCVVPRNALSCVLAAFGTVTLLQQYPLRRALSVTALALLVAFEGWFVGPHRRSATADAARRDSGGRRCPGSAD